MQDKQVYLSSQEMSAEHRRTQGDSWDAVYSSTTLRSALRRLLPRTMLAGRNGNINSSTEGKLEGLNELEDTVGSGSSFADIWDNSSVEIRDQDKGDYNATTSLLLTCKSQVIYPYFYILSLVAWRPFNIQSFRYQGCSMRKFLNIIYTLIIFVLIIFSYVSSILACQARLEIPLTPATKLPKSQPNSHHGNINTAPTMPTTNHTNKTSTSAVMECTHIFSTYVVPDILHFLAFLIGFYMFRIQESEGLHALIEKFPEESPQGCVFLGICNFILFCFAYNLESVTGFIKNPRAQRIAAVVMGLGRLVELCVSVVTIVNYCAQCELLIFYIREITLRMEEKTKDLDSIMKDILEVKKNLSRVNGLISVIATLIIFSYFELSVIGVCNLSLQFNKLLVEWRKLMYRIFKPLISFAIIIFPITIAARLTSAARKLKQNSLQIRVFGYPSASQLDLDSFVLFTHSAEMKAKLLFMPVQFSFLSGVVAVVVFVLLLMLQLGIIAGKNKYL
ncbi:hypothetical protein pdam_00003470 [Pocillopora damicornis]|uniref:Gustatory receptor n=1 Tax=Pocillopora damicornis TaxID=46731 RepID=A0A3M6V4I1_POCDA|nr:hypothetical protein pdam_00003470 [Pocillopora damicornis]